MDALYSQSRRGAEEVIQGAREVVEQIDKVLYDEIIPAKMEEREKAFLVMVCDSLRRIVRYSNGIAEASLNIKASKSLRLRLNKFKTHRENIFQCVTPVPMQRPRVPGRE